MMPTDKRPNVKIYNLKSYLRKRRIIKARLANPSATLEEIGHDVGVSREYARLVLKQAGLSTVSDKRCHPPLLCLTCGKRLDSKNSTGYCQKHLKDGIPACPQGHPYNEKNTRWAGQRRICRVCKRIYARRHRAEHKAQSSPM